MNGGADADEQSSHTGRHRREPGADTWTPAGLPRPRGGRHQTTEAYPSFCGELPVPRSAYAPQQPLAPRTTAIPGQQRGQEEPIVRRTRVTLTPTDDEVRVYVAPPADGLGSFDLGSVPASVTPPRSWRRAAWFATASSGGVVLALLFAGSVLVGKPDSPRAGTAWLPGLGGGLPTFGGEQHTGAPATTSRRSTDPGSTRTSSVAGRTPPGTSGAFTSASPGSGSGTAPTTTTTQAPQKPPPTPAPYDKDPWRFGVPEEDDAHTLAATSQEYLDKVTEDLSAAHAMTTGELQQEGTHGLERKYADVAYFQVEHIQVHQYEGETVCTVKTVHKDGSETTDRRKLTLENGKVESDGG